MLYARTLSGAGAAEELELVPWFWYGHVTSCVFAEEPCPCCRGAVISLMATLMQVLIVKQLIIPIMPMNTIT